MPFVIVDPSRNQSAQADVLRKLRERYPIFGFKIQATMILLLVLVPQPPGFAVGEKQRHRLFQLADATVDAAGNDTGGPLEKFLRLRKGVGHGEVRLFKYFVKRNNDSIKRNFSGRRFFPVLFLHHVAVFG